MIQGVSVLHTHGAARGDQSDHALSPEQVIGVFEYCGLPHLIL